ncbi:hypothetical protein [Pandoravirus japonicus]|uniref:Uncharacterized protein n=1 Tax=Pandoravirus japonicus TaxID=2823154 RepID=A0A811BQ79_9VIRU|nr:hypothetical protein [Pandoravirus japonicus]
MAPACFCLRHKRPEKECIGATSKQKGREKRDSERIIFFCVGYLFFRVNRGACGGRRARATALLFFPGASCVGGTRGVDEKKKGFS